MNFLLSANDNYIVPLTVCLTSILENHKEESLSIYILQSDFSEKNKKLLLDLSEKYKKNIYLIDVDHKYYNQVPTLRWSKETYYRLLINETLPRDLDRIIYLDCDIIVNKNLNSLYNLNIDNFCIAALPESNSEINRIRLGLSENGLYFQAGVLLINLIKSRDVINYEKSIDIINRLGVNMIAVDQDIINIVFDNNIKPINNIYNDRDITDFNNKKLYRFLNWLPKKEKETTKIFHFSSGKPWNNLFSGSCEELWYKYLILSPFSYLYETKYNKLKYKILRTGMFKSLFYFYILFTKYINIFFLFILNKESYNKLKEFYRKNIK